MGCRRFCRWVSLSVGVLLEKLERGVNLEETVIVEGGLQKWRYSHYGSSVRRTWRCKKGSLDGGHLFLWRPHWKTWERAHMPGLMCGRWFWEGCLFI
jgi:hypothetical protein